MASTDQRPVYRFGDYTLDTARGALLCGEDEVNLRPQSIDVLQVLLERHGQLVSKEELHDSVWGQKAVTDDSMAQCVADIRRALNDVDRKLLRTLPRRGYMFDGDVAIERPGSDAAVLPWSAWIPRAAGLVVVLLAAWLGWSYWTTPDRSPSIAVLPLINMSPVADNAFFSEGVHEEILTNLSRVDGLRVISRTTMTGYLNSTQGVKEIARELDAEGVDVRLSGERRHMLPVERDRRLAPGGA